MDSTQIEIEEFPEIVMKAINFAGSYLHNIFSKFNADKKTHFERYNWIKTELTSPSFEDFTFSYKNAIFPVVIDVVIDGKSLLRPELKDRLCNQSTENDLIPCVFEVVVEGTPHKHENDGFSCFKVTSPGFNLKHAATGKYINPEEYADDSDTLMSEWELRNLAVSIVKRDIEARKEFKLVAFCDVLNVDPQIWFDDESGKMCWVIVRFQSVLDESKASDFTNVANDNKSVAKFDGYFAPVSAAMGDAVLYDLDGKIIPPSRRFDGTAPLYRGHELYINYKGLIKIHSAE